ncbi:MAG: TMEM175 family protein [Cyclobacteriaceae bacterium]
MRQVLKDQEVGLDPHFHYRGKSQTRIETFSDAAFALAITLLVLSSTVPESLSDLIGSMRNVVPFGICVTLISVIWYQHYVFFLRYGLQSVQTVVINSLLLFLVLVYVYPLKFLTRFLFEVCYAMISGDWDKFWSSYGHDLSADNMALLMIIYGMGASLIFLTLAWLYRFALKKKEDLGLDEYEIYQTRSSMRMNLLQASIPLLSTILAAFFGATKLGLTISGFCYYLYPVILPLYGRISEKRRKKLLSEIQKGD